MRTIALFALSLLCAAAASAQTPAQTPATAHSALVGALPRHGLLGAVLAEHDGTITVTAIVPGSAAAAAHLEPHDVIRAVAGRAGITAANLVQLVRRTPGGTTIALTLVRAGVERHVDVMLGVPADETDPLVTTLYQSVVVQGTPRRTLLDVPKDVAGRRPAVLLIGGIGCYSVDVATHAEDGYLRVTRDIARAGFVTLRLEKSGVGDSQGPPCRDVDFNDESASYAVAFDALARDPHVDPAHVYLLGHSIGTLIAPRLALDHRVAGVIVSEAVGRDWFEYELQNLRRQLELGGDPPGVVDAKLASKERCMHRLLIAREPEAQIERDEPDCAMRNGIYPVAAPYVQQVAALNIIEPWTRIGVPVLAVYGTSDYVVAPEDHVRIVDTVNRLHPGRATLRPVEAMDHNLQFAATAAAFFANNADAEPTRYQSAFSDAVLRWLCDRERCRGV